MKDRMRWWWVSSAWFAARQVDQVADWLHRVAHRMRPALWTPFDRDGKLRPELVMNEGWCHTGALVVDGEKYPVMTRPAPVDDEGVTARLDLRQGRPHDDS